MNKINCFNQHYGRLDLCQLDVESGKELVGSFLQNPEIMSTVSIFDGRAAESQFEVDQYTTILCGSKYKDQGIGQYKIMSGNKVLGIFGVLLREEAEDKITSIDVGYLLMPEVYGKKVATDVLKRMLSFLFDNITSLDEVVATTMQSNKASQRVLLKNGFVNLGYKDSSRLLHQKSPIFFFLLELYHYEYLIV